RDSGTLAPCTESHVMSSRERTVRPPRRCAFLLPFGAALVTAAATRPDGTCPGIEHGSSHICDGGSHQTGLGSTGEFRTRAHAAGCAQNAPKSQPQGLARPCLEALSSPVHRARSASRSKPLPRAVGGSRRFTGEVDESATGSVNFWSRPFLSALDEAILERSKRNSSQIAANLPGRPLQQRHELPKFSLAPSTERE